MLFAFWCVFNNTQARLHLLGEGSSPAATVYWFVYLHLPFQDENREHSLCPCCGQSHSSRGSGHVALDGEKDLEEQEKRQLLNTWWPNYLNCKSAAGIGIAVEASQGAEKWEKSTDCKVGWVWPWSCRRVIALPLISRCRVGKVQCRWGHSMNVVFRMLCTKKAVGFQRKEKNYPKEEKWGCLDFRSYNGIVTHKPLQRRS